MSCACKKGSIPTRYSCIRVKVLIVEGSEGYESIMEVYYWLHDVVFP